MQIETEQHVSIRAKREKNTCVYPCKLEYVTEVYFLFQICNSYCEGINKSNLSSNCIELSLESTNLCCHVLPNLFYIIN